MEAWIRQFRKGLLEMCVLNLLAIQESYGYQIVRSLQNFEEFVVTESTLYPILTRLKKDGFLKVRTGPSQSGPPRRYYSLTSIGQTYTESLNEYWDGLVVSVDKLRSSLIKEVSK
jgi:PadR family transcriptional regulator PadR